MLLNAVLHPAAWAPLISSASTLLFTFMSQAHRRVSFCSESTAFHWDLRVSQLLKGSDVVIV